MTGQSSFSMLVFHRHFYFKVIAQIFEQTGADVAVLVGEGKLMARTICLQYDDKLVSTFRIAHCIEDFPQPVFVATELAGAAEDDAQELAAVLGMWHCTGFFRICSIGGAGGPSFEHWRLHLGC